jgi:hypothetical protein
MSVRTETRIISARAVCNVCDFDTGGRQAPDEAVKHCEETGHAVTLNTNTFTNITKA